MDFGHLSYAQLDKVNFILPPEPESNLLILKGDRSNSPKLYVGCPRWSVKEWVGKLYSKGTREANFLEEYKKHFNCIELNSTLYNLYDESAIAKWADKAGDIDFKFCPKVFQGISHEGHLDDKLLLTHAFEKSIVGFGEHLGPSFLQPSEGFGPQRKKELQDYLQKWPSIIPLFVELRNAAWFQKSEIEDVANMLRRLNKGLIITDTAGRRDVCHMYLTAPRAMIRFVANNLHPTDHPRIDKWVKRIQYWLENGLEELYFIIHMDQEKHSPELAAYLIEKLNDACGLKLKKPGIIQQELF